MSEPQHRETSREKAQSIGALSTVGLSFVLAIALGGVVRLPPRLVVRDRTVVLPLVLRARHGGRGAERLPDGHQYIE